MINRRVFLVSLTVGVMALAVVVAPAIADELFGVITKVDTANNKVTVVEKDTDKEVEVTTNDSTQWESPKGARKLDLEKLAKNVEKQKEKGKKGVNVVVTHEKGIASKIAVAKKKAAADQEK